MPAPGELGSAHDDVKKYWPKRQWPLGWEICEQYFSTSEIEREVQGECGKEGKFYTIQMLVVSSGYEGQNVEQGLVHWGVKQAAVECMPVLAIATPHQKELYESHGFQVKRKVEVKPGHERVYLVKDTAV
ncbi:uncharacterized protein LDX57_011120 [Aspergillus melleus]|uniref:uncharacterized protein n=1 Tax=Aspergillus melleus TaxID=138277 RepID=UPI001E8E6515|nr:uncharacterized protein LDX57_011120 [Aspergillus melleus]KAH8433486.1 hypothetical protein LDX57_011120 [Aspergillus melleus]